MEGGREVTESADDSVRASFAVGEEGLTLSGWGGDPGRLGAGASKQNARCARLEAEIGERLAGARQRRALFRGELVDSL
jgi:hypothetical protein